jgi:hypothetical protein
MPPAARFPQGWIAFDLDPAVLPEPGRMLQCSERWSMERRAAGGRTLGPARDLPAGADPS